MKPLVGWLSAHSHRIIISVVVGSISAAVIPFLDLPLWFGLIVLVGQVVGYNVIAAQSRFTVATSVTDTLRLALVAFVLVSVCALLLWAFWSNA